jgi:hypothetical protein
MPEDIDIRVTPSLDPQVFKVEGYGEDTRGFVDCIITAVNDVYVTCGRIHDARELWERNPTVTPENRILIVGQEADKQKDRVLKRLSLAERDLRANIAHVEGQLMEPLTEKAGLGSINTEVRAFVRGLDPSEREKFMREALEQNDESTLTAVLGAQHFLSGLAANDKAHFLRLYHEKQNPQLVRRLDVMNRVLERFERTLPLVDNAFAKAVGAKPSVVAQLERANEQAKAALNIQPTE